MHWLLLLIPVFATILLLLFAPKHKVTWWEHLIMYGVTSISILITIAVVKISAVTDTEYWNNKAIRVTYYESWNEYIHKTCSSTCCCDSKGENCQTTYYDCSYVQEHSAYWEIEDDGGHSINISKEEYQRIVKKWNVAPVFREMNHPYYTKDGDAYYADFPGGDEKIECVVTSHSYTNKVQAADNIFKFPEVKKEAVKKYDLYEYPRIYDGYKQDGILGDGDKTQYIAEQKMQALNAKLGRIKQLKAFILIYTNQPEEAGRLQESYWKGGNKNEYVLTIGVDDKDNIQWVHPFSWAKKSIVKVEMENFLYKQKVLNLSETVDFMYKELDENFERKPFSEFNYLRIRPKGKHILIAGIIILLIVGGIVAWVLTNEFENTIEHYGKQKNNNFNKVISEKYIKFVRWFKELMLKLKLIK